MRKTLLVAQREFWAAVRTKAFIIGLLAMPIMMGGSILMQLLVGGVRDTRDKHFVMVDRSPDGTFAAAIKMAVQAYNEKGVLDPATGKQVRARLRIEEYPEKVDTPEALDRAREVLSDRVRKGELLGFVEIGPDVVKPAPPGLKDERYALRFQTNRAMPDEFRPLVEQVVTTTVQAIRGQGMKLQGEQLKELLVPVPVVTKGLSKRDPATGQLDEGKEAGRLASVFVPLALLMLMFMVVMMTASPLMQGVLEEKMQRIAEVLLGSVTPFQLMLGKLLGMTAVSLTIAIVYLAGGYWTAYYFEFAEYIPLWLLIWFFLYQSLAALMYGSLFIAIGAACTDLKETQSLLMPVMLLVCLPMFVLGSVLAEPNGPVATGLSFFPFATPMLMIARQSIPPGIPLWQPLVGTLIVLLTTLVCVWAAGRIFRVGLLMQGKGARFGEMLRWVVRG